VRSPPVTTRVARPADAEMMARTTALGFETYRAFGGSGRAPVVLGSEAIRERLRSRATWALLAEIAGEPAGHVAFFPDWRREDTAYLWQLFVRPAWWGSGLAADLHEAFVAEAVARGLREGRLNTPAAHARARRFYERRGWRASGPPEPWGGMAVAEYGCALPS
jgi:GNAT superfamily N-acetyltransferase